MQLEVHEVGTVQPVVKLSDLTKVAEKMDLRSEKVEDLYFVQQGSISSEFAMRKLNNVSLDIYLLGVFLNYIEVTYSTFLRCPQENYEKMMVMNGSKNVVTSDFMNRYQSLHQLLQQYDNHFDLELALEHIFFYTDLQVLDFLTDVSELSVPSLKKVVLHDNDMVLWRRIFVAGEYTWISRMCSAMKKYIKEQREESTKNLKAKKELKKTMLTDQIRELGIQENNLTQQLKVQLNDRTLHDRLRETSTKKNKLQNELFTLKAELRRDSSEQSSPRSLSPTRSPKTSIGVSCPKQQQFYRGAKSDTYGGPSSAQMLSNAQRSGGRDVQLPGGYQSTSGSQVSSTFIPAATYYDYSGLNSLLRLPRNIGNHWAWIKKKTPDTHVLRQIFSDKTDVIEYVTTRFPALVTAIWVEAIASQAVGKRDGKDFTVTSPPAVMHIAYNKKSDAELKNELKGGLFDAPK